MSKDVYVIAEAGVNHNGSNAMAFRLIDEAVASGVDAIKFQTFKAKNIVTKNAPKADYQVSSSQQNESQYAMLKKLELDYDAHFELMEYCNQCGIQFLSTAFDLDSLFFLTRELKLATLKVSSSELTNAPLLLEHARTKCDLIVSTGMATLSEIENALGVIAYGLLEGQEPSKEAFIEAYKSDKGQKLLKKHITLLHCTTEYPAPFKDINLSAMNSMRENFNLPVGYSDHSEGIVVPIIAASLGAVLIEKHFTLDKSLPGPDHMSSLEPDELKSMVNAIRVVEQAKGDGIKEPCNSELRNIEIVRKSLVANKIIEVGDFFTADNVSIKRPGTGRSPIDYWDVIGEVSNKKYNVDDQIS